MAAAISFSVTASRPSWLPAHYAPPLQQHPAYGLALGTLGVPSAMMGVVDKDGDPIALYLGVTRRFLGLAQVTAVMRGPVFLRPCEAGEKSAVLNAIQQTAQPWRRRFVLQSPDIDDSPAARSMLKSAKLRKVITGHSSARLDLSQSGDQIRAGLKSKWRNQLRKAEKSGLDLVVTEKLSSATARWLIASELQQRKIRGYHALPGDFLNAWALHGKSLVVAVRKKGELVAGGLFLIHGSAATYQLGLTTLQGRDVNAQNLVLFASFEALKARGVASLDLGGLDSGPLAKIGHFKLGTGAIPYTLAGSWSR